MAGTRILRTRQHRRKLIVPGLVDFMAGLTVGALGIAHLGPVRPRARETSQQPRAPSSVRRRTNVR